MVTGAGHHRTRGCVEVGGDAWSIGPWSACGRFASRAPMTRRHVEATGGFQRGGVPADGHPSRGATHRASHEHGLHRHMEIDEHGWLQENARDTPTPPTQPLIGSSRDSTAFAGSGKGQHGFIVLVRVRQTRKGLRPDGHDGDRPAAADADEHPCQTPNCGVSPVSPLRVGQAARLPAPEQIRAAAQEEHREEQRRDLRKCRCRHWNRDHHARGHTDGLCFSGSPSAPCSLSLSDSPRARTDERVITGLHLDHSRAVPELSNPAYQLLKLSSAASVFIPEYSYARSPGPSSSGDVQVSATPPGTREAARFFGAWTTHRACTPRRCQYSSDSRTGARASGTSHHPVSPVSASGAFPPVGRSRRPPEATRSRRHCGQ